MAEDKKKDQQFRLEMDANKIARIKEGEFEGTITAILTRGSRAVTNQQIQLYLAGQPFGNVVPTDENGRVIKDFSITTAAKTISVEAQTVGFATRAKKFIDLPRPEKEKQKGKPRPHKFTARAEGKDGDYKIIVFVFAEDGQTINNQLVVIETDDYRTNNDGTIRPLPEINFSEEEKKVQVQAGELTDTLTLFGKQKWRKPPEIPPATDENLRGSFWQVIKCAVKQAQALKRRN